MADSVLLIDDDPLILRTIGAYFESLGTEVHRETSAESGVATFERARPDVVVLDLHLPDADGLQVLERLRTKGASVIFLTGHGDISTAVRAMQLGAEHFLTKPVDFGHLAAAIARVSEKARLQRENAMLRARDSGQSGLESLGPSAAMQELARQIRLLAASERTTVLLSGESGTGKGWVARQLHELSERSAAPFVEASCTGTPAEVLESLVFGHEKGSGGGGMGSDSRQRQIGLLEVAEGGTIFFDEIGDLPAVLQPKLLNVIETKKFRRAGGTREIALDVRMVAATSYDLEVEVRAGRFREDLLYRLSVMPLRLPPLRERTRADRLALVTGLITDLRAELPGSPSECSSEALDRLLTSQWLGNVRELRNVLERAMILARGQTSIGIEHLPAEFGKGGGGGSRRHVPQTLADVERLQIERTLRHHNGNRTRAAHELGISRATLINKIKTYALDL